MKSQHSGRAERSKEQALVEPLDWTWINFPTILFLNLINVFNIKVTEYLVSLLFVVICSLAGIPQF